MHVCSFARARACVRARVRACVRACVRECVRACVRACVRVCVLKIKCTADNPSMPQSTRCTPHLPHSPIPLSRWESGHSSITSQPDFASSPCHVLDVTGSGLTLARCQCTVTRKALSISKIVSVWQCVHFTRVDRSLRCTCLVAGMWSSPKTHTRLVGRVVKASAS